MIKKKKNTTKKEKPSASLLYSPNYAMFILYGKIYALFNITLYLLKSSNIMSENLPSLGQ